MNDELGNRLVKVGSYLCGRAQRTNPAAPLCSALFLDISTSLFGFYGLQMNFLGWSRASIPTHRGGAY